MLLAGFVACARPLLLVHLSLLPLFFFSLFPSRPQFPLRLTSFFSSPLISPTGKSQAVLSLPSALLVFSVARVLSAFASASYRLALFDVFVDPRFPHFSVFTFPSVLI